MRALLGLKFVVVHIGQNQNFKESSIGLILYVFYFESPLVTKISCLQETKNFPKLAIATWFQGIKNPSSDLKDPIVSYMKSGFRMQNAP